MEKLTYEQWYDKNEEDLSIECAETGADRELDFDFDQFYEDRYEHYLKEDVWVHFYFEGNQAWGSIKNADDWLKIKDGYEGNIHRLSQARNNPTRINYPAFGFYSEYTGKETLGDFFKQNNMKI